MQIMVEYDYCEIALKENEDVIIRSGVSSKNLELAKQVIGTNAVKSLFHYRDEKKMVYQTTLYLVSGYTVLIDGGITSGYVGSGPGAFRELLVYLGINEERAERIAEIDTKRINQGSVTIDFF